MDFEHVAVASVLCVDVVGVYFQNVVVARVLSVSENQKNSATLRLCQFF